MSTNDGGPAFPAPNDANVNGQEGMTLRDYFAAKAMQAMVASQYDVNMRGYEGWREDFGREAYRYADAMLAAREQTP